MLPFKIDYVSTFNKHGVAEKAKMNSAVLEHPERIEKVTDYILEHFEQKTHHNMASSDKKRAVQKFNSLFAVSSIEAAKKYYLEF